MMNKEILLINGPNLNLLGKRDKDLYGSLTLDEIVKNAAETAKGEGLVLKTFQSNVEGEIVNQIQNSLSAVSGIIINPGAYSHTSIAIRDALECFTGPIIEVHISNIHKRESFRHHSFISQIASGVICGLGPNGYNLAVRAMAELLKKPKS